MRFALFILNFALDRAERGNVPIKKSAKKALRQSLKRKIRNLKKKREIRDLTKEIKNLISKKKIKESSVLLPKVYKALDKAAETGVIKESRAARKKSSIAKELNKLSKGK